MSNRKGTCTSDNCDEKPVVHISFRDGASGNYCHTCASLIQRNKATGVKSVKPMKGH